MASSRASLRGRSTTSPFKWSFPPATQSLNIWQRTLGSGALFGWVNIVGFSFFGDVLHSDRVRYPVLINRMYSTFGIRIDPQTLSESIRRSDSQRSIVLEVTPWSWANC